MIESQIAAIRSSLPCETAIVMPVIVSKAMLEDRVDNVTPRRKPRGLRAAAEIPLAQLKSRKWRNTIVCERTWVSLPDGLHAKCFVSF